MHPTQILTHLGERGFRVLYDRATKDVTISPTPNPAMAKRLVANEDALVGYLDSLEHQPALAHAFTVESGRALDVLQDVGVCIACGIPWVLHGEPPQSSWLLAKSADAVSLVLASPLDGEPS